jgi:translation initiation factor IF-3
MTLHEAIRIAQSRGVDLVEVADKAEPPVCRLVDYGKWIYEKNKEDKESRKHQHASKVKEVQLSPSIDPHDFGIKLQRCVEFLSEEMKVKVVLKFRGREMMHKEIGFQVVNKLIKDLEAYGQPDADPKLAGKSIVLMLSPLPRGKRGRASPQPAEGGGPSSVSGRPPLAKVAVAPAPASDGPPSNAPARGPSSGFTNNPFANLELDPGRESSDGTGS